MIEKTETTFWVEKMYTHNNGTEQTAKVILVINYKSNTYSINPSLSTSFKFENGHKDNYNLWIAIMWCLQDAIELAKEELKLDTIK